MMGFTKDTEEVAKAEKWLMEQCPIRAYGIEQNKDIIAEIIVLYMEYKIDHE